MDTVPRDQPDPIKAALIEAVRAELQGVGHRRSMFVEAADAELDRLAALLPLAESAHLRAHEVADRAGVSRQTVVNLRNRQARAVRDWPVDLQIVLELGLRGPQSLDGLSGVIAQGPVRRVQVEAALLRLVQGGVARVVGRAISGTTDPVDYYKLTWRAVDELPLRLRHATMPDSRRWTAYVISTSREAIAIAAAGESALGEHGAAVIPAGTAHGMEHPEVAFQVEATDAESAAASAGAVFRGLCERAGLGSRESPVVISTLLPPVHRQRPT